MARKALRLMALVAGVALAAALFAADKAPDFTAMIDRYDKLADFGGSDLSCVYSMVVKKPGEKDVINEFKVFRRDGSDQLVIIFLKPKANAGQGFIKEGDIITSYDPESKKFSVTSFKESLSTSDAKLSDFKARRTLDDYSIASTKEGMVSKFPVWVVELKAKSDSVTYDKVLLYVRKDNELVMKQEEYSLSGRLMRSTFFPKYVKVGEKMIPSTILNRDEINVGEETQITISDVSTARLPDSYFTRAFLEKYGK